MDNDFYKPSKWRLQEIYYEGKIVFVPQYKTKFFWRNVTEEEFENVYLALGYIQIGWIPFKVGFISEKFAKDFIKQVEERRQRIRPNPPMPKQKIWHSIKNLFPKYIYIE
jgi:hypothetical protein